MPYDMLGKIVFDLVTTVPRSWRGTLADLIEKLTSHDKQVWFEALKHFLRKESCWVSGQATQVVEPKPSILELVGTVVVPATTTKFTARDKFVVNTKPDAEVKIVFMSEYFESEFLDKIEEPQGEQTLYHYELREPITKELGGEDHAASTLTDLFLIMKNGVGSSKILYIKNKTGVLRAVSVYWFSDGWDVDAGPAPDPNRWDGAYHVFSRQPVSVAA